MRYPVPNNSLSRIVIVMAQVKTVKVSPKVEGSSPKSPAAPKRTRVKRGAPVAHGVGRRKSSVARVWLRRGGKGALLVNGREYQSYFTTDIARADVVVPFRVIPGADTFDVEANVHGGGINSQAGAVRLGIARALLANNESLRIVLREHDLLTVDARVKERKKYGQKAARRKFQFVKR